MRKKGLLFISSLFCLSLFLTSCERDEGEGGKASIEGTIYKIVEDGNVATRTVLADGKYVKEYYFVRDTIAAAEADVYIIYGKNTDGSFDDRIRTSFNGNFKFKYLVSGNYTVFAYDNLPNKKQEAQIHSLKIGGNETYRVPDMYVMDGKNVGLSAIVGQVMVQNKYGEEISGAGLRVYINGGGIVGSYDDVRADDSGTFIFTKLEPGKYDIWAESEPVKNGPIEAVRISVEIKEGGTIVRTTGDGSNEKQIELHVVNQTGGAMIQGMVYKIIDDGNIASRKIEKTDEDGNLITETEYYFVKDTIPAAEEDIYIIYGNDSEAYFEDRLRTSYNGKIAFQNLLPGDYTVFAYDNLPDKKQKANVNYVTLSENETYTLPSMYIKDGKNAGLWAIRGRVKALYSSGGNPSGTPIAAQRVYIRNILYKNITDDTRTDDAGYFIFTKLAPGEYEIWAEDELEKNQITPAYSGNVIIPEGEDSKVLDIANSPILIHIQ